MVNIFGASVGVYDGALASLMTRCEARERELESVVRLLTRKRKDPHLGPSPLWTALDAVRPWCDLGQWGYEGLDRARCGEALV